MRKDIHELGLFTKEKIEVGTGILISSQRMIFDQIEIDCSGNDCLAEPHKGN